jgi:hypothetical protein
MIPETARDRARDFVSPDPAVVESSPVRDHLLQCSRRVDWRFLLPSPELGVVARVGSADAALDESLQLFADVFVTLDAGGRVAPDLVGSCDVVVVRSSRPEGLVTASSLVRDGGSLYWEVERTRDGFPASPAARALLAELGFEDARYHWHRPTFGSCLEIVPLRDEEVLRWVLGRCAGSRAGAVRLACARLLRRLGLLRLMVSSWSCVARKSVGGSS